MSLILDTKYFLLLQPKLEGFKKVHSDLYQFRCPICGDSKSNKSKARGYMYTFKEADGLIYKCHNCGYSTNFRNFLKEVDPQLYRQYTLEYMRKFGYNDRGAKEAEKEMREAKINDFFKAKSTIIPEYEDTILKECNRLDTLSSTHPCVVYAESRKIPYKFYPYLYYTDNFKEFVNGIIPAKITSSKMADSRLIIPYFDKHGHCYAFQGRSLDPENSVRYCTIKIDDDKPKIFGIDRVDYSKTIYCLEGGLDSLFLPNAIAVSGSSYDSPFLESIKPNVVIVPDNERRNKQVANNIRKMIDRGFKVCLWRDDLGFKDINEAILKGYSESDLISIISEDTVQGLKAKVKFSIWKRV